MIPAGVPIPEQIKNTPMNNHHLLAKENLQDFFGVYQTRTYQKDNGIKTQITCQREPPGFAPVFQVLLI